MRLINTALVLRQRVIFVGERRLSLVYGTKSRRQQQVPAVYRGIARDTSDRERRGGIMTMTMSPMLFITLFETSADLTAE